MVMAGCAAVQRCGAAVRCSGAAYLPYLDTKRAAKTKTW